MSPDTSDLRQSSPDSIDIEIPTLNVPAQPHSHGHSSAAMSRNIGAEHFRVMCDYAPDATFVIDMTGRVMDANPAALALLKTNRRALLGTRLDAWVSRYWHAEVDQIYAATTDGFIKQVMLQGQNGTKHSFTAEIRYCPCSFEDQPAHLLYVRDISAHQNSERALQRRNRYLTLLNQAGQAFSSSLEMEDVLSTVLNQLRHIMGASAASIWLIDEKNREVVCTDSTEPWFLRGWRLPLGQGIIGWTALEGESVLVSDTRLDERHYKGVDQKSGTEMRCILSVPLKVKEKTIGALQVVDNEPNTFSPEDMTIMESLAATAAIAVDNARLFKQVSQDAENRAALVQEVNHRVKNNLSSIIGLLYSELRYAKKERTPEYSELLQDLIGRIQSMAQVHAMLSSFEWMPLPLAELTRQMVDTALHIIPNNIKIDVSISSSDIHIPSSQATNLALIINELTTNTIKYALDGRTSARIAVNIALEKNDIICYEFRNDGSGYPDEVVMHQRYNLGLYLIDTLVTRGLQGTLTLHNDPGPVTTIRFKRE